MTDHLVGKYTPWLGDFFKTTFYKREGLFFNQWKKKKKWKTKTNEGGRDFMPSSTRGMSHQQQPHSSKWGMGENYCFCFFIDSKFVDNENPFELSCMGWHHGWVVSNTSTCWVRALLCLWAIQIASILTKPGSSPVGPGHDCAIIPDTYGMFKYWVPCKEIFSNKF